MTPGRKLTVLHLVANRWWTGSAEPVIRLLSALAARGHRALLGLAPGDRFEDKARQAGLEPLAGLSLDVRFRPGGLVHDVRRLRGVIRAEAVDVVHTHHSHDHWLGALVRGAAALVRTFHNARAVRADGPARWLYRRTDTLVAVSEEIAQRCREVPGLAVPVCRVAGVVDVERFAGPVDPRTVRAELGPTGGPLIGCVSRLAANRGHELLLRAFAQLGARWPAARLVLVGKGEARPEIEALVSALGLGPRVVLAGYRDADLPAVLGALDVFALMAPGSDESCRAALEAMAAGRPVVARRVGALPESVEHGVTGLLLDDDRPEGVASALESLLGEPARARAMGEAGRVRARGRFSPERHAADTESIYLEALARRSRLHRGP